MSQINNKTKQEYNELLEDLAKRVSRVRVRLVLEAILQTFALGVIILPIYVVLYAWIDHYIHLNIIFRSISLAGLIGATGWLIFKWSRVFMAHISLSYAANYIEGKQTYNQQLVAAIEYHEQKNDYPYSRTLAEHMVRQVHQDTHNDDFSKSIRQWPSILSILVIFAACISVGYLIKTNCSFYNRYFTRLIKPVAEVKPMPATSMEILSGDIIAEPDDFMELSASISGRIPESGILVIEPDNSAGITSVEYSTYEVPLVPTRNEPGQDIFHSKFSLKEKGKYLYHFESGDAKTNSKSIQIVEFPKIESITAKIRVNSSGWVEPYTEEVESALSIFESSNVTLEVKTNQPINSALVRLPNDREINGKCESPDGFSVSFSSKKEGKIVFELVNLQGLKNPKPIDIKIIHKQDMPPQFELISPGSDYIATNVASIPIEFKVSDDFALHRAAISCEFNDGSVIKVPAENLAPGSKDHTLKYMLELEDYQIDVSDSIIFYASAKDADTSIGKSNPEAQSTPYFVEIRPYRKFIVQPDPSTNKTQRPPDQSDEGLMRVLEYNRAFLKKTWALSQQKELLDNDNIKIKAIGDDISYSSEQLQLIRNNPKYRFSSEEISRIDIILENYDYAVKALLKSLVKQAVVPEKESYHDLRKLIVERVQCPPPVDGVQPETRDRLELKDPVHVTRYEKERIEAQMKQLAQELAELRKDQENLKHEYVKFFDQEKSKVVAQEVNDSDTWLEKHKTQNQSNNSDKKSGSQQSQTTMQGAKVNLENTPKGAGGSQASDSVMKGKADESKMQQQPSEAGQGSNGYGQSDVANEMMRMFRSQQNKIKGRIDKLSSELGKVPIPEGSLQEGKTIAGSRETTQEHLENASESMDDFNNSVADQYYNNRDSGRGYALAAKTLDNIQDELANAEAAMIEEFATEESRFASDSEKLAKKFEDVAISYEESVSEMEKQRLLQLLEQAKELMKSMPENIKQDLPEEILISNNNEKANSYTNRQSNSSASPQENNGVLQYSPQAVSGAFTQGSNVLHASPASGKGGSSDAVMVENARFLAKQFWSLSIHVRRKMTPLAETQTTHPEFIDDENLFFENTASYGQNKETIR